jgi:hypothetical protein
MANIVIDPVIITTPSHDASIDEVERWLENLTAWLQEALTAPFTWLHYQRATDLLACNEQFPDFQKLKQLQQKHRLDINIRQIASDLNAFFREENEESIEVETYLKSLEYAVEFVGSSVVVDPKQFVARLPEYLYDDVHLLLAECCACKHIGHTFGQTLRIATQPLANNSKEIAVSATIVCGLPDSTFLPDTTITQNLPLLITPNDLQPLADIIALWSKGQYGIIYAIQQQYKKETGATLEPDAFRLGPHFIQSIDERGLDTDKTVLHSFFRAAADVIADRARDRKGYKLHKLREDKTADSPQRTRDSDQAKAWRLMLQQHGAGWRLHYWKIPTHQGYIIEFANVCRESEDKIC